MVPKVGSLGEKLILIQLETALEQQNRGVAGHSLRCHQDLAVCQVLQEWDRSVTEIICSCFKGWSSILRELGKVSLSTQ